MTPNRFAGKCKDCGCHVSAGQGAVGKDSAGWITRCKPCYDDMMEKNRLRREERRENQRQQFEEMRRAKIEEYRKKDEQQRQSWWASGTGLPHHDDILTMFDVGDS